jgi:hypothetical protein
MKKCDVCSHSRAAHTDGIRCALCGCTGQERQMTQQPLAFRSSLPVRVTPNTRKR